MLSNSLQAAFVKCRLVNQYLNISRSVRNVARRGEGPKLIRGGTVKTLEDDEFEPTIRSYKDLVKSVQSSKLGDQLEIEKNFLQEDYHGDVFERCDQYYSMHLGEEKQLKSSIKKGIIGRKYFKLDKETNLLTYAAKVQIRFLHELNPLEWNYKALSECFPVSEAGVKKLLKSSYVLKCPGKIKAHDEDVARKWEILKSGKFSNEIFPRTRKLYEEGKLVDDYFSGNPNLPTAPKQTKKVIEIKRKEKIGEFSAIVQTHVEHEKQKSLESKENFETQVSLRDARSMKASKIDHFDTKDIRKLKITSEESDEDADPEVFPCKHKKIKSDEGIPFSQFKELLKEESLAKVNSKHKSEYDEFVLKETSKSDEDVSKRPQYSDGCHLEIPKYEKEDISLMYEKDKNMEKAYKYDEKLGYQYPLGEKIKGKIKVPSKQYQIKGKLYKKNQCVYAEDGEFLYRVPT